MIRLAINGALGRMGRTVGRLAAQEKSFRIVAAIESAASDGLGCDYGTALGLDPLGVDLAPRLSGRADAMIDFSTPEASLARLAECAKSGTAHLICTTGFTEAQKKEIRRAAKRIPVLPASNTSIGVTALLSTVADLARMLGEGYDVEIVEMHHRRKKDAPSGTALSLAEAVASALGRTAADYRHGREGAVGERPPREIGLHAVRGGGVVGDHDVIFASEDEVVTVSHRAMSRDLFARGALRAARWLAGAKPGLYAMRDVLGGRRA